MSTYTQIKGEEMSLTEKQNGVTIKDAINDEYNSQAQCGLGGLRCRCLQVFAHPNAFVISVGLLFMTMVCAGGVYIAGVISTIEKRFQLRSSESGLLLSMDDISGLCAILFVAYFGGKSHRPRIIGISSIILALGTFVTALPQFLYDNPGLYGLSSSSEDTESRRTNVASLHKEEFTCNYTRANHTECTTDEIEAAGSQLDKAWPIILGQLLCGVGGTAIFPLSLTYLDDAVEKTLLPMYLAIMLLPMTISPLIGFSVSGYCLSLFTDFYKTDASELGITPRDPQWQGAWWLGFIIFGCMFLLLSIPFFFFPRKMDKPKSYFCFTGLPDCCKGVTGEGDALGEEDIPMAEVHSTKIFSRKPAIVIKKFLASLWRLVTNVTYISSALGFCFTALTFSGFGAFIAKYIQFQFGVLPSKAGLLLGFTAMPASMIGVLLGGILTTRLARSQRSKAVLTIVIQCLSVLSYVALMFLGCPNDNIAGLTTEYGVNGQAYNGQTFGVAAPCNVDCMCEKGVYSPVCGADKVTYVTACFAGCETVNVVQDNKTIYQDCRCFNQSQNSFTDEPTSGFASPGACATGCDILMMFIVFLGISFAIKTSSHNSSVMLKFRSVLPKDRELSVGLSSFLSKILGFIPAPIIFGGVIDSQCSFWQESCDKTGECMVYDRPGLLYVFPGLTAALKIVAVLCYCVSAYSVFKNEPVQDEKENETKDHKGIPETTKMKTEL